MMARSLAEQYRTHREAFLLSQQLGCTPREAEAELRRRASWQHLQDTRARLQAKSAPQPAATKPVTAEPEQAVEQKWMMRD